MQRTRPTLQDTLSCCGAAITRKLNEISLDATSPTGLEIHLMQETKCHRSGSASELSFAEKTFSV